MKKFLKSISLILALTVLLTACQKETKSTTEASGTGSEVGTELTTRATETAYDPDIREPNQTIETMDSDKPTESDETAATDATTASGTTAKPAAKKLGKVTVTDLFKSTYKNRYRQGKVTSRLPKITIEGVDTKAVNKEISNKFLKKAKNAAKHDETYFTYKYYIGKTYVSILITYDNSCGGYLMDQYVYNISRTTGKKMSKKQMLKALGISNKKFNSRVKKVVKRHFTKQGYPGSDNYSKTQYKKAMSSKTINRAIPWVNAKGKVCFLINAMPIVGGADEDNFISTC